jgi:dipeptidyl aminopeptidase/acylaminoacyl peptidase
MVTLPVSESEDGSKIVYFAFNDRTPGAYFLFHANADNLERIAEVSPWIKPEEMAEMQPIAYPTRDGQQIRGYLTLPKGREPKQLPLVVMPHGGPWLRDTWGFDRRVQFLANRGYAVLQPNYRGSTGYGLAFMEEGYKQRGMKLQDDLADGVAWAVREGIADSRRIAVFGTGFGGYVAMVALSHTPTLYRCGITYAGLTDVKDQAQYTSEYAPRPVQKLAEMRTSENRSEKDLLPELSVWSHLPRVRAPVLLIYGGKDDIVPLTQSRRLERALLANGKGCEFYCKLSEHHAFSTPSNVFKLYQRIDEFLRKTMQ